MAEQKKRKKSFSNFVQRWMWREKRRKEQLEPHQHESETMKGTQTKWIINEHHDDDDDDEISTWVAKY